MPDDTGEEDMAQPFRDIVYESTNHQRVEIPIRPERIQKELGKQKRQGEIVDVDEKDYKKLHGKHVPVATALAAFVAPIAAPVAAVVAAPVVAAKGVANLKERKEVMQQQQSFLAMLFYMEGLQEFLEG